VTHVRKKINFCSTRTVIALVTTVFTSSCIHEAQFFFFFEKLIVAILVKIFLAFYETSSAIAMFTREYRWNLF
jgi:hypothetical protein